MNIAEIIQKCKEATSNEEREACFAAAEKLAAEIRAERDKSRDEMNRLICDLLTYDSESIGDAIKCYISQSDDDISQLSDAAYKAYCDIAQIRVLEWEC